ncbi:hypothetical protein TELCIR_04077 [Teladorsagia circumcincta]|uniref:Uncharacterized protein n=1 Tax=Teladorsagia circumcincta TaxID=45464 RepID=A0A2G9UUT9_TELCI|nr:hypothetical protein TELCIR_04077 [Teladorsagia circumcincta]
MAKLLEGHDVALDQLCRDMWERWTELSPLERLAITEKMNTWSCNQHLLSLNFVKEKKKEKMLQKLGMKKGQRSENENPPVQVTAVSRLLCSGASKHTDLTGHHMRAAEKCLDNLDQVVGRVVWQGEMTKVR